MLGEAKEGKAKMEMEPSGMQEGLPVKVTQRVQAMGKSGARGRMFQTGHSTFEGPETECSWCGGGTTGVRVE